MRTGLALNCITANNSLYFRHFIPRNTGVKLLVTILNLRNVEMVEVEPCRCTRLLFANILGEL
jgi:hypothetical protein